MEALYLWHAGSCLNECSSLRTAVHVSLPRRQLDPIPETHSLPAAGPSTGHPPGQEGARLFLSCSWLQVLQ